MSSLGDGPFGSLQTCAFNCFAAAVNQTACLASNTTCLCMDTTFFTQATGCTTLQCGVKAGLSATNLTMSTCEVPQADQSRVSPILAGVLGMLALIMVSLRLLQRGVFNKQVGIDDVLILGALICAAPLNCCMFPMQKFGLGKNIWTIPFNHISKQLELLYVAEIFYMVAEALTQISFLAFYLRIFPSETFHRIAYVLMGLSACFGISNAFVMIFQCTPVSFFWFGWAGEMKGHCVDINTYSWYKAAMQIAMDLSILSLPIWPLVQLSLRTKKKIQIVLMFCTGFVITIVSCLRLQSLVKFSKSTNVTYDNTPAIYWSVVECDVAIICACMPCIPSLLRNLLPSVFGPPSNKQYNSITPPQHGGSSRGSVPLDRIKKDTTWQVSSSETHLVHETGRMKTPQSS